MKGRWNMSVPVGEGVSGWGLCGARSRLERTSDGSDCAATGTGRVRAALLCSRRGPGVPCPCERGARLNGRSIRRLPRAPVLNQPLPAGPPGFGCPHPPPCAPTTLPTQTRRWKQSARGLELTVRGALAALVLARDLRQKAVRGCVAGCGQLRWFDRTGPHLLLIVVKCSRPLERRCDDLAPSPAGARGVGHRRGLQRCGVRASVFARVDHTPS